MPTTRPESASSSTIGNISCERWTVRSRSAGSSSNPGRTPTSRGSANRMNSAVSAPRTSAIRKKRLEATRKASLPLSLLQQLGEHRDEGALQRRVGEQGPHQVGHLEGDGEGRHRAAHAEVARGHDLADEAEDPGEPGGDGEEGGATGESAAALRRSPVGGSTAMRATLRRRRAGPVVPVAAFSVYGQHRLTRKAHPPHRARAAREPPLHLLGEDLASPPGGGGRRRRARRRPSEAYRTVCSRIDRAVRTGALHRNTGARKKARAARLRAKL